MKSVRDVTGMLSAAPRYANALRDETLDNARAFDEGDVTDKPFFLRRRQLSVTAMDRIAEHHRQRQRTLLSVDDAVVAIVRRCGPASSTTPTSCSPPTTATCRASTTCRAARCSPTTRRPRCR